VTERLNTSREPASASERRPRRSGEAEEAVIYRSFRACRVSGGSRGQLSIQMEGLAVRGKKRHLTGQAHRMTIEDEPHLFRKIVDSERLG
jgi:hypothetical protein